MKPIKTSLPFFAAAGLLATLLGAAPVWSAPASASAAERQLMQQRYRSELAVCRSGRSNQSLSVCVAEARAAYAQALQGRLDDGAASYRANANRRCHDLTGSEQQACQDRMQGAGSTTGSVAAGGIYRELTTVTVGAAPIATPAVSATAGAASAPTNSQAPVNTPK